MRNGSGTYDHTDGSGASLALFLTSQRKWQGKVLGDEEVDAFKGACVESEYTHILPHGSYLVNLGNPSSEAREKSYEAFVADLQRCERLGIQLYNFHPGSSLKGGDREVSLAHVSDALNRAHAATNSVVTVIENMAGQGSVLGATFEEIKTMIDGVKDKSRMGVCLDTCHLWSAGMYFQFSSHDSRLRYINIQII